LGVKGYDWSAMHHDRRKGPLRLFLSFLSLLYDGGVRARLLAYRLGIFRRHCLPVFVVSIGNLTVGGTGKTPAVQSLAKWALDQGYRPAVLSRGYGGRFREGVLEVSDGRKVKTVPKESGDEPYLLAQSLPDVPVIVSKARYRGGLFACEKLFSNFLILDDGFQHVALGRDLDIVLLDASNPFGNGFCLPRGPLREPIEQLERADVCVLTRCGAGKTAERTIRLLREKFDCLNFFLADHVPVSVVFPGQGESLAPEDLKGAPVAAFSGIAHPASFKKTLEALGARLVFFEAFGDHHVYTPGEVRALLERKEELGARYLLMTEKDWVKVEAMGLGDAEMGYVKIEFRILGNEEEFYGLIRNAFGKKQGWKCRGKR